LCIWGRSAIFWRSVKGERLTGIQSEIMPKISNLGHPLSSDRCNRNID
jgi:hypothetical protein